MKQLKAIAVILKTPSYLYVVLLSLMGSLLLLSYFLPVGIAISNDRWITIYAMTAGVVLLDYFMFQLPPEGHRQSMDSTIFLATVFVYGVEPALLTLAISTFFIVFNHKDTKWWKHFLNLAMYTFMIVGANYIYLRFGGETGTFETSFLPAFIVSLAAYFCINVLLIGTYYFLVYKGRLVEILRMFIKEVLFAYLSILLLSMILVILLIYTSLFGLFLFLIIATLLSHVFKQLFLMYHEINDKANKDQRTGLYNHSYLEEKLDDFIKTYREDGNVFSFAMLDLDDFKKYNDLYGHPQGDKLLSFVGSIIKAECEPHGFVCARYGGEEFAVIMPAYGKNEARKFINQLRKTVNNSPFEGVEILPHGCVSFSAGVMEMNADTYEKSQLVGLSDRAMYISKSKGKNTVTIYGEQTYLPQKFEHEINELEQQIRVFLSKDVYTFKHSKRVFSYAVDMAEKLGLNEEERRTLILGALIHDIGKLEIPREVLTKRAKLSKEEWELVKQHVTFGKEFLLASGTYSDLVPLVELHHERYDGTGYPHGLKGTEIPKLARLLCIIDSFDAMTTERPYQRTRTFEEAVEEIQACSGSQFDPELAVPFIAYVNHRIEQDDIPEEIIQQLREQQEREGA